MSVIDILLKISPALEEGKSLENASTWGNVVNAQNALVTVIGFGLVIAKQAGYDLPISDDQVVQLAGAVAGIGFSVNSYFHHALNPKAGFKR